MGELPKLKTLQLYNNPIQDIPQQLFNIKWDFNCFPHLQSYFANKDWADNRQCKMILVGNGCVGKTTLAKRLIHNPSNDICIDIKDRTHGIVIQKWQADPNKDGLEIMVWDFAGQAVFHATHRLFLSQNALYLLVYAEHPPEDPQDTTPKHTPEYWLDYITELGKESRVLLVKNLFQQGENKRISNKWNDLLEKYETNSLLQFGTPQSLNAQTSNERRRKVLLQEIIANAEELLENTPPLPQKWVEIRKQLAELEENRISYAAFQAIGAQYQLSEQELQTILLYLHNSGDLFYQADTFDNQIILNLDWAIRAVYDILKDERIKAQHTRESYAQQYFTLANLCALFPQKDSKEVELYLNFMQSCQLVFCERKKQTR